MNKTFNIKPLKMEMERNGFIRGFNLKRDLTYSECSHILKNLLGIWHTTKKDCSDGEDWKYWRGVIVDDVNKWLRGERDDSAIREFASDCMDEDLGLFNLIPIICYLQKKEII